MEDVASSSAAETARPAVILFTGAGKARAATFTAEEAEVAERAAGLMGLRVLRIDTDEHRLVAASLSHGKIYAASSKALVPFCRGQIVTQLSAFPEVLDPERPAEADRPIAPPKSRKGRPLAAAEGEAAQHGSEPVSELGKANAPALMKVGDTALAAEEGNAFTWYPARVTAQRGDELFVLQWVDGGETIVRRRDHLSPFPLALVRKLK